MPLKNLTTVFSVIAIANIRTALTTAISDHLKQKEKSKLKQKEESESANKGLVIGLSVDEGVLALIILSGFLYWFFKIKK